MGEAQGDDDSTLKQMESVRSEPSIGRLADLQNSRADYAPVYHRLVTLRAD